MKLGITLAAPILFCGASAHAAFIVVDQFDTNSNASFTFFGTTYAQHNVGSVGSQAIAGGSPITELRTAGRVHSGDIAANARLDDHMRFAGITVDQNNDYSSATYTGNLVWQSGGPAPAHGTFYLPASYLEVTSFIEAPDAVLNAQISASLHLECASCPTQSPFYFQALLTASFTGFSQSVQATGGAGVDVTPLENPVITDTIYDFGGRRTTNILFPAISGAFDLGMVSPIATPAFHYSLIASVWGTSALNVGIASINDPFFFESDPVQSGAPVVIDGAEAAAPEPGPAVLLMGAAAGGLLRASRHRR